MSRLFRTPTWRSIATLSVVVVFIGCQENAPISVPVASRRVLEPEQQEAPKPIEPVIAAAPVETQPQPSPEPPPMPELPPATPEVAAPVAAAPEPEPIAASLEAAALSRLFQDSDSTEADRLLGKRVELTGYVLQIRNLGPQRLVVLGDEHFSSDLPDERVLCHVEHDMSEAGNISSPRLKVSGTCQLGYGNLVVLRNCKIDEELPALEGFEERRTAFAEKQDHTTLAELGVGIDGEAGNLSAKLNREHLVGGRIIPGVLQGLSRLEGLRVLQLTGLPISDEGLREISFLSNLQEIALDETRVSAEGLAALAEATNLRQIKVDGTTLNEGFAHLANCTNLESLELRASQGHSQFSEIAARHLSSIRGLVHLNLDGAQLNAEVMDWIGQQSNLHSLSLEYTTVNFELLRRLSGLTSLKSLSLSGSTIDDDGVLATSIFPQLTELDLSQTKITDAGIANLSQLRQLQKLDLTGCPIVGGGLTALKGSSIEILSLWGTKADNEAMLAIESLTSLKRLRLGQTKITYAALSRLAALQKLEQLELTGIRLHRDTLPVLEGLTALKELRLSENPFDDCEACLAELSQSRPSLNLYLGRFDYLVQAGNPGR